MKQLKNTIIIFMISILLLLASPISVLANSSNHTDSIKVNSPSCLLIDANTGKVLYEKKAYEKMYPASTTKLMTAILTLENCKLTDVATVSHNAIFSIPVGYSHANLQEGEKLTVEQLLNVLLIPSANDAAVVLAEHISGSVSEFCKLMNQKAKELGCKNTNFVNPNGIHDKNHYSTSYDLSLIGKYAMKFPDIMRIAMVTQYTLPKTNKYNKTDRIFNATNALINNESLNTYYYPYATGLKTGYTDSAGSCIVTTAKKGEMKLLLVVLNSDSVEKRYEDCIHLFNYGFNNYTYTSLNSAHDIVKTIDIQNGTKETKNLDICVKDDITVLLSTTVKKEDLKPTIEINSELRAPIAENMVVGKISYEIDGDMYSSDLVAASSVIPSSFEVLLFRVLAIFLILYIIYLLLKGGPKKKHSRKKHYANTKKRGSKSKNFKKMTHGFHNIHNGNGEFKFTQMADFLD